PRIGLIFWLCLGKIDLSEPLDCDMVVCPAVVGRDIIPVGHLLELIDKPLLLQFFAFKDNPWFQNTASCSHGFEKASPSAGLGTFKQRSQQACLVESAAFKEGLLPGIATANNQRIQALTRNGLAQFMVRTIDTHQIRPLCRPHQR
ncbi:hypothetical protein IWW34DRAFT_777629, partial [Fusarium oxysporum f. sp. albedinis]